MRNRVLACALAIAVGPLCHSTSATVVVHEPYDYPAGSDISGASGGTGWSSVWFSNIGGTATAATGDTAGTGSLTYVDALGNSLLTSGNRGLYAGTLNTAAANGTTSNAFRRLPAVRGAEGVADNTTTWLSFVGQRLGQKTGATPTYERGANLSLFNSTLAASQEQLAIGEGSNRPEDTWSLIPEGDAAQNRPSTTPFDQLSLLVLRIDHQPGNDDAYLFVNPTLGVEPLLASAAVSVLGTNDFSFDTVRPFGGGSQNTGAIAPGEIQMDEIRVGDTYADVTPFTPVPEPAGLGLVGLGLLALGRRVRRVR